MDADRSGVDLIARTTGRIPGVGGASRNLQNTSGCQRTTGELLFEHSFDLSASEGQLDVQLI